MKSKNPYSLYFYGFVLLHILIWTLLPTLLRNGLTLDSAEAVSWGYEWQLGYLKHPPLSGWMAEAMMWIFPGQVWATYFLAQLCVAIAFVATWKLAKDFLSPRESLMSVLLLEAIYYYNFIAIEFNANIALLPFWSLVTLYAWKVTKNPQSTLNWLILAVFSAAAFYAKYYAVMLFGGVFLLFVYRQDLRRNLLGFRPYIFVATLVILIFPHLVWLIKNDFSTLSYVKESIDPKQLHFYNRLLNPFLFICAQALSLLLPLLIFFYARRGFSSKKIGGDIKSDFLIFVLLVPLILAIVPSALGGSAMKDMWGSVMWSCFGVALFHFFSPSISEIFSRRFFCGIALVVALSIIAFIGDHLLSPNKYAHFNNKLLIEKIREKYPKPIAVVVGDIWLTGNMNFFDKPRPHVLADLERYESTIESLLLLEKNGGIILWNAGRRGDLLPEGFLYKISAGIEVQEPIILPFTRFGDLSPYRVGWAIVVPSR